MDGMDGMDLDEEKDQAQRKRPLLVPQWPKEKPDPCPGLLP